MYQNKELNKLEEYLKKNDIEYFDKSEILHNERYERIHITDIRYTQKCFEHRLSVICGYGSYEYEKGLLEYWTGNEEPVGYQTAEDVIKYLENERRNIKAQNKMLNNLLDKIINHPSLNYTMSDDEKTVNITGTNLKVLVSEEYYSVYIGLYFDGDEDISFTDVNKYITDVDEVIKICEKVEKFVNTLGE